MNKVSSSANTATNIVHLFTTTIAEKKLLVNKTKTNDIAAATLANATHNFPFALPAAAIPIRVMAARTPTIANKRFSSAQFSDAVVPPFPGWERLLAEDNACEELEEFIPEEEGAVEICEEACEEDGANEDTLIAPCDEPSFVFHWAYNRVSVDMVKAAPGA